MITTHQNRGTRLEIIEYRTKYPEMTLLEIGNIVGVSRERVRQILSSEQLQTKSLKRQPPIIPDCKTCGNKVPTAKRIYCSEECRRPVKQILKCDYCKKEMIFAPSLYNARNRAIKVHCSRECYFLNRTGKTQKGYRN